MKNWSRHIHWSPASTVYPQSEREIQQIIQRAVVEGKKIRPIGSGHSFNPFWQSGEILLSLDRYQGLVQVDPSTRQATVRAGTKLRQLGVLLADHGLALENMGDIDAQSIAGTISTGTHGTGLAFGSISTQVRALKFINGRGEIIHCSTQEQADLFRAAQVSLGALGVITEITLQCVPAYRLTLQNRREDLTTLLADLPGRWRQHRNFEFYWFPHTKKVWTKAADEVSDQPDQLGWANYLTEYVLENYVFQMLCEWARLFPGHNPAVARLSASSIPNLRKVYQSHKVYATKRLVRFKEMEYSVPLEAHREVLEEIIRTVEKHRFPVHFPIENRVVRGDDIYLSPAYGRDSAYLACHVYARKDHRKYFRELEAIFRAYGGRPHWGKMHQLTAAELEKVYPEWAAFKRIRVSQDPDGIFLNNYLQGVLG